MLLTSPFSRYNLTVSFLRRQSSGSLSNLTIIVLESRISRFFTEKNHTMPKAEFFPSMSELAYSTHLVILCNISIEVKSLEAPEIVQNWIYVSSGVVFDDSKLSIRRVCNLAATEAGNISNIRVGQIWLGLEFSTKINDSRLERSQTFHICP